MKIPEITEITEYLINEKNYDEFTAQGFATQFWHFYDSKGWKVGTTKMQKWKSAIATWELRNKNKQHEINRTNTTGNSKHAGAFQLIDKFKGDINIR